MDDDYSDNSYEEDADTSDDYDLSETVDVSSDADDAASDAGMIDEDGCPMFIVRLSRANINRTLEIPFAFWQCHLQMEAFFEYVYFNVDG